MGLFSAMPFTANKASFHVEPATWNPDAKQYRLLLDGQPYIVVSSLRRARQFVRTSNAEDRRIRNALRGHG